MVFSRAFICSLLLSVCTALAAAQFPTGSQIRWRTVASGSSSTETRQKLQLASERTELENLWTPVLKQNRSQPIVDFTKDRLVIIFLGTRNTGGYSAQVREVANGGGSSATVFVDELYPGPKQKTTQGITSPWVMIAVDRSYLDINAKIQKVENNQLPSFQINPLTTFTPMPWDQCGYGYGGRWSDPCGFGFDSPYDFQNWCGQNRLDYPSFGQINFNLNRLVFISAGDYGLGYGIQIGDVFLSGQETVVQVRRNGVQLASSQRSYLLLSLGKQSRSYVVEYLINGQDCYVDGGAYLPFRSMGAWISTSSRDIERLALANAQTMPQSISGFDYAKGNLGVVFLGEQPPHVSYSVDRVAYRGSTAVVYVKKSVVVSGLGSKTLPYFAFRFDKKIRAVKVVDVSTI